MRKLAEKATMTETIKVMKSFGSHHSLGSVSTFFLQQKVLAKALMKLEWHQGMSVPGLISFSTDPDVNLVRDVL